MLPRSWRQTLPLAFLCENRQVWGLDRVTMHQFVTDSAKLRICTKFSVINLWTCFFCEFENTKNC